MNPEVLKEENNRLKLIILQYRKVESKYQMLHDFSQIQSPSLETYLLSAKTYDIDPKASMI